jgi:hypothetical protein
MREREAQRIEFSIRCGVKQASGEKSNREVPAAQALDAAQWNSANG